MKVADIMQRDVVRVSPKTKLRDVAKLIFGLQIAGVPVVQGKKLVGLITETDLLHNLYPSFQEFMEDYIHAKDFEAMEEVGERILNLSAKDIMNKRPTTVPPDTPIMRVQSMMLVRHFSRVPVVDKKNHILGIVSQGDIFRAVIGQRLPLDVEEEFHDWMARYYDILIDWEERLSKELPSLIELLHREKAEKVLDVASGTGEHAIALAKKGFNVVGMERSGLMHSISEKKKQKLATDTQKRLLFRGGEYKNILKELSNDFDAVICMGNVLSHVIYRDKHIVERVAKVLKPKQAVMVFQITNFDKVLQIGGFREFSVQSDHIGSEEEHLFLTFYKKGKAGLLTYNLAIFDFIAGKWVFRGINSTPIVYIGKEEITTILRGLGFTKISYYGSMLNGPSIEVPFNSSEHDWLNVVAKRG